MTDSTTPWANTQPAGPLLRPADAAAFLGVGQRCFYQMVEAGEVPAPFRIRPGGKATAVPKSWLDAVVTARAGMAA